jgi:hypothetical protein
MPLQERAKGVSFQAYMGWRTYPYMDIVEAILIKVRLNSIYNTKKGVDFEAVHRGLKHRIEPVFFVLPAVNVNDLIQIDHALEFAHCVCDHGIHCLPL